MNALIRFLRSDARTGLKIMVVSMAPFLICTVPLLLYIIFGPSDGNPIGLGLLFVAGFAISTLGFLIGVFWLVLEQCFRAGQP